jgi:putative nucleotidyltransferase with HDIG domain
MMERPTEQFINKPPENISEYIYKELFEYSTDAIIVYDVYNDGEDFVILDINPKAQDIEKIKKIDVIGKKITEIFPVIKELPIFEAFKTTHKTGITKDVPVVLYEDDRISGYRKNTVIKLPSDQLLVIYNDETDIEFARRMLDATVNTVYSMIFTTIDGLELEWCNDYTLKSLRVNSIDEFKKEHDCICEYFEEDLQRGYIGKEVDGVNWLDYTIENQDNFPIKAKITHKDVEKIYSINTNKVEFDNKKRYVVVLNDITDLENSLLVLQVQARELIESRNKENRNFEAVMHTFVNILEEKDTYTAGHSKRVAQYSREIAKSIGCSQSDIDTVYRAGHLHDIGKIITPESILLKPGTFNNDEYALMKEHSITGYAILNQIDDYKAIAKIIRSHHEKYDGSGYPDEISKQEIPLLSRVMTIADSFDAMTTNRIYKPSMKIKDAIKELDLGKGTHFDPNIIPNAIAYFSTLENIDTSKNIPDDSISRHRFAYFFKDNLTSTFNSTYLDIFLSENLEKKIYANCTIVDIHNLHKFNKKNSWESGDKMLKKLSAELIEMSNSLFVFRIHGDMFVIVSKDKIEHFDSKTLKLPGNLYITKKSLNLIEENVGSYREMLSLI